MTKPERILHANIFNFGFNGLSTIVYQWGMHMDPREFVFDYCGSKPIVHKSYEENILKVGGEIFIMPNSKKNNFFMRHIRFWRFLTKVIKENGYSIVHLHSDLSSNLFERALICKLSGVKKVVVHSHSTGADHATRHIKTIYHKLCRPLLPLVATDFLACSADAAAWMYPKHIHDQVEIINNGIPVDEFKFNPEKREEFRNKLGIENCFVIGHVGRFTYQKNHEFIINTFSDVLRSVPEARLLLIGEGELKEEIFLAAEGKHIKDKIIYIPFTAQVEDYLNVMDCFVLPSRFEGLGIVGIEAQASGLHTLVSDRVPKEAFVTDLIKALPIDGSVDCWVEELLRISREEPVERTGYCEAVKQSGYSIDYSVRQLMTVYER